MKMRVAVLALALAGAAAYMGTPRATYGLPAFARETGVECSSCHTVWPQLTEMGRNFKRSGYSDLELKQVGDKLALGQSMFVSGRVNLRLVDKRTSKLSTNEDLSDKDKQLKMRALHEVEVYAAGRAGDRLSYFTEIEAEDEWADPSGDAPGFQVQLATGAVQYKLHQDVTAFAGYLSPFYADGYNTLDWKKTNRRDWSAVSMGFLPGTSQTIGLAAHHQQVSGLVAWGGNPGDLEGHDPKDLTGRLAVEPISGLMIGGFGNLSKAYDSSTGKSDAKTTRFGADAQVDRSNFSVNGVFAIMDVDKANTESNLSLEGHYIKAVNSSLVKAVIPQIGVDRYTVNDGDDSFVDLGAFLTLLIRDNIHGQLGWEGNLSTPDVYKHKESRITAVLDFGF